MNFKIGDRVRISPRCRFNPQYLHVLDLVGTVEADALVAFVVNFGAKGSVLVLAAHLELADASPGAASGWTPAQLDKLRQLAKLATHPTAAENEARNAAMSIARMIERDGPPPSTKADERTIVGLQSKLAEVEAIAERRLAELRELAGADDRAKRQQGEITKLRDELKAARRETTLQQGAKEAAQKREAALQAKLDASPVGDREELERLRAELNRERAHRCALQSEVIKLEEDLKLLASFGKDVTVAKPEEGPPVSAKKLIEDALRVDFTPQNIPYYAETTYARYARVVPRNYPGVTLGAHEPPTPSMGKSTDASEAQRQMLAQMGWKKKR